MDDKIDLKKVAADNAKKVKSESKRDAYWTQDFATTGVGKGTDDDTATVAQIASVPKF